MSAGTRAAAAASTEAGAEEPPEDVLAPEPPDVELSLLDAQDDRVSAPAMHSADAVRAMRERTSTVVPPTPKGVGATIEQRPRLPRAAEQTVFDRCRYVTPPQRAAPAPRTRQSL